MKSPESFIRDLAEVGVSVEGPWDLVNVRHSYPAAIPVLIDWLGRAQKEVPQPGRPDFKEGIVRSLSVKEARGKAGPALLREFRQDDPPAGYRWAVGNALEVVSDDALFEDIVSITRDRRYGRDRQMVVLALGRMKNPQAIDVLIDLLGDEEVVGHAVKALGRLKARRARRELERCLIHPKAWVRSEAKRALAKLES